MTEDLATRRARELCPTCSREPIMWTYPTERAAANDLLMSLGFAELHAIKPNGTQWRPRWSEVAGPNFISLTDSGKEQHEKDPFHVYNAEWQNDFIRRSYTPITDELRAGLAAEIDEAD